MICRECGRNNPEGQVNCCFCGTSLSEDAPGSVTGGTGGQQFSAPNTYRPAPARSFSFAQPTAATPNYIGIAGAVIALIGLFLPFWKFEFLGYSKTYPMFTNGFRGYLALVAASAGIFAALKAVDVGVLAAGGAVGLMGLLQYSSLESFIKEEIRLSHTGDTLTYEILKPHFSTGTGCSVLFIGAVVMIAGGVIGMVRAKQ